MAINEASIIRRLADVTKVRELAKKMPRLLSIIDIDGNPARALSLRINIPTVKNSSYPQNKQDFSEVVIELPERYPFPPGPSVIFKTPVWNPNIYQSGKWCYGEWKVTENLELFVIRLMKVIALDPTIINPKSAANGEAARWYIKQLTVKPRLFPTVSLIEIMSEPLKPKISWNTVK